MSLLFYHIFGLLHHYKAPNSLPGGSKNGTVFWHALSSSNINRFSLFISLSESAENLQ